MMGGMLAGLEVLTLDCCGAIWMAGVFYAMLRLALWLEMPPKE